MVVKMMKWRPWPPLLSRKFEVKLVVKKMEGANSDPVHADPEKENHRVVEIKWKGPKITLGLVILALIQGSNTGVKNKVPSIGKAYLDIVAFASFSNDNGKSEATSNFPR
ncbi:hypothetical protein LXL04_023172 [Taraxacum kok-saghyz]